MSKIIFVSDKTTYFWGWSRRVKVDDLEYTVSVRRGKSIRIPYKPRGKNRGWQWSGAVYRANPPYGRVWEDRVSGSIGCRGLLLEAGVLS